MIRFFHRLLSLSALQALAWTTLLAETLPLIPAGAEWRYFKGLKDPSPDNPTAWRLVDYSDSGWSLGNDVFYYGEQLTGTWLDDMQGNYTSLYLRKEFTVADPTELESLTLNVRSDDGFVAWLNGEEIARFNVPQGDLAYNATASTTFSEPIPYEAYPIAKPASRARTGKNILAVQAFNVSLSGSSDFVLSATLDGVINNSPPLVERILPDPAAAVRTLNSVEVQFTRPVQGVDASDLLIQGKPATGVSEISPGQFLFSFPNAPSGTVTVEFATNPGISDLANPPRPFAGASWTYSVEPNAPAPGISINEFMAKNKRTLRDEDGDASDWIELFNSATTSVSLTGWTITDDPAIPNKWRFPAVRIEPNSFLVVFASGKNRTNNPAQLHTSFKLSNNSSGYIGLTDLGGGLVSAITDYPAQIEDISYGRPPGSSQLIGYFVTPTPGKVNTAQGPGFAPPVDFSTSSQTYRGSMTLTLSTTNANAVIRYTLNGTAPSVSSPSYTDPIILTNAVQVRAQAFANSLLPGPIRSETYIPLADSAAAFSSDLPVVLIHDFNRGRPSANVDTFAHIQIFEPDTNGVTSMTNPPSLTSRAVIAARGSSTEGYSKVSMKVEFQDELGFGRALSPLGLPEDPDWVLYAPNNFEPVLIHNPFAHQLSRDIGRYSPRTRFVEVYLVQTGLGPVASSSYHGIYVLEEKIKLDPNRVDAPKLYAGQNSNPQVTGGYLMKIDRADPGDSGFYAANQWVLNVNPKESDLNLPERQGQKNYLQKYMNDFGNALYGPNFRSPTTGYRAYIDTEAWIDHHLINVLTFNVDALRLSAYFYKQREGKLHFGPLWDFDRALNSTDGRDANPRTWRSTVSDMGTDFFNYTWWDRLFMDPDFYQQYIDRYQELRQGAFGQEHIWGLVDRFTREVTKAQPREQTRWGIVPRLGYASEVNRLKNWLTNRLNFMDGQFVQPPVFVEGSSLPKGVTVELTGPANAQIYYTLDGTDPRQSGGATGDEITPKAALYSGPILLQANARIMARSRNASHKALTGPNNPPLRSIWSGPIVQTFVVQPYPIRISEIMYHPKGDGPDTGFTDEDFEFVELQNTSGTTVDLTGFRLAGAVEFRFSETNAVVRSLAAGKRLILAGNAEAFRKRYPMADPVAGVYTGRLQNGDGRLTLWGPLQEPVANLVYRADAYPETDGQGYSMVLKEEETIQDPSLLTFWRASSQVGGSPGSIDPPPFRLLPQITGGMLQLKFTGEPGKTYQLQELVMPAATWQSVDSKTPAGDGSVDFSIVPVGSQRLYRVLVP